MDNYLITVVFLSFFMKTVLTEADLQQQNADQDHLNPLNDYESADNAAKDQDKRTIFGPPNYGWAKHVGYHPSGFKYVLGYTPVSFKLAPMLRPVIKHQGYYYGRPKVHLHVKKPVVHIKPPKPVYQAPWRPPVPVLPANVPPPPAHVDVTVAVAKPPVHLDHVHPHVDHVRAVSHGDHVHKFPAHVDHVHALPQPVPVQHLHPVPLQPVAPLVPAVAPPHFIPSPLFEVTKPNLGVLPFGAVFSSPVLREIAAPPVALPVPFRLPQPVVPAAVPLPQPAVVPLPQPVHPPPAVVPLSHPPLPQAVPVAPPQPVPQPLYPPGTVVEYHGTTGFINLAKGQVPILPQTPVNAAQPIPPHHYYLHYPRIPQNVQPHEQHDVQSPFVPVNNQNFFQQQLPQDSPSHFQPADQGGHGVFQQQLPVHPQTQFQADQNPQNFFQQQVPQDSPAQFQPADQVSTQHFFQQPTGDQQGQFQPVDQSDGQFGGYVYEPPSSAQQSIQPGQTDLQLPVHLPHHPGFVQNSRQFQPGNVHDPTQFAESVFRPSIQLEPPYKK